ncbi:MAG: amidohydrolase [Ferroplasma sp.]
MRQNLIINNYFDGTDMARECTLIKVEDGKITDVKAIKEAETNDLLNYANTLDFRGKFITPGLIDSHDHFTLTALKIAYQANFGNIASYDEFNDVLKKNAGIKLHGWIQGYGLNEYNLNEKKMPDRHVIDHALKDVPVFITHITEHYALCNSMALEIAGITGKTENPPNGKIGRDINGEPDGILYEAQAMDLVKKCIPEYNLNDYINAIISGSKMYMEAGLTAVKDIGGTGKDINEETRIKAFNYVTSENKIGLRLMIALPVYSLEDVDKKILMSKNIKENNSLRFSGFKLFLDGSIMSRTAWMKNPYKRRKENEKPENGISLWNIGEFHEAVNKLAATGSHISIHVIGDRAIEEAVNTIEDVQSKGLKSPFALVHAYKLDNPVIERIKKLSIGIETQAAFIYFIGNALQQNLENNESKCLFPFKTLIEKGIKFSNGSDSPVSPYSPLYGIFSCIYREIKNGNGQPAFNNQNITLIEALKSYTSNSSEVTGWNGIGTMKPGSNSDFTVWSTNPEKLDSDFRQWSNIELNAIALR